MKKLLAAALLFVIAFSSCKKYPDGPSLSLRSKKARLANSWVLTKVIEDGTDKTSDYQTVLAGYNMVINKEGTYSSSYKAYNLVNVSETGTWQFSDDKLSVIFDPNSNNNANNTLTILKLKEKELWVLDPDDNGKKVEYHLIPK